MQYAKQTKCVPYLVGKDTTEFSFFAIHKPLRCFSCDSSIPLQVVT